jgi:hypothetical protein
VARLAKAPVRGNLSDDRELIADAQRVFHEFEPEYQGAKDPNLVFLNRTEQMIQAVVIYTSGDQPVAVARSISSRSSMKELASADAKGGSLPLSPFLVLPVMDFYGKTRGVVGLAPPGCLIEHSTKGGFAPDGSWVRSFEPEPTGDYVVREARTVNELWRVSCEGKVREVRTADDYLDALGPEQNATVMYDRVVRFSGLTPGKGGMIQWRGKIPGVRSELTLVVPQPLPGPAMLAVGPFPKAVIATDLPENLPAPSTSGARDDWSMISLGIAGDGVTVVRMPQMIGDRPVLGDQVFVYTDTDATRVEALDPQLQIVATAPVNQGVAILSFGPGLADAVRAVTSGGKPISSVRFAEPAAGPRLLGDQLLKDW